MGDMGHQPQQFQFHAEDRTVTIAHFFNRHSGTLAVNHGHLRGSHFCNTSFVRQQLGTIDEVDYGIFRSPGSFIPLQGARL